MDVARLDHFRGFETYWEIPATESTAQGGQWRTGPGDTFFAALREELGALPIIAEDLGLITEAVSRLRLDCGFPGMRVMQFAFGDTAHNPYLPHNFEPGTVAYTGTHDNDTTIGWWHRPPAERHAARQYLGRKPTRKSTGHDPVLSQSVARTGDSIPGCAGSGWSTPDEYTGASARMLDPAIHWSEVTTRPQRAWPPCPGTWAP